MADEVKRAPCTLCTRETNHTVLAKQDRSDEDVHKSTTSLLVRGAGLFQWPMCGVLARTMKQHTIHRQSLESPRSGSGGYASCLAMMKDRWANCCMKIYEAVQGKQHRLALMGIRAFFEQLMIAKVGDQGSFAANLNKFLEEGFIAKIQLTAIKHILESGHAAIHRGYKPVEHDLNTALNIVEAITETIYFHERDAKQVAARVPPRGSLQKKSLGGTNSFPLQTGKSKRCMSLD